jgi:hypothetical protein
MSDGRRNTPGSWPDRRRLSIRTPNTRPVKGWSQPPVSLVGRAGAGLECHIVCVKQPALDLVESRGAASRGRLYRRIGLRSLWWRRQGLVLGDRCKRMERHYLKSRNSFTSMFVTLCLLHYCTCSSIFRPYRFLEQSFGSETLFFLESPIHVLT